MANLCEGDILKLATEIHALQKRLISISEGRNNHFNFDRALIYFNAPGEAICLWFQSLQTVLFCHPASTWSLQPCGLVIHLGALL
jgi:hypothetical protein